MAQSHDASIVDANSTPSANAMTPVAGGVDAHWTNARGIDDGNKAFVIEAWKHTLSVQMHFNDICLKLRNLAITMLAAVIGLAAYSTKEGMRLQVGWLEVPIGTVVAFAGLIGWIAFYAMDRHWYHVFLGAASIHASKIEDRWREHLPELLLSSRISQESKRTFFGIEFKSGRRLNWFYGAGATIIILTGLVVSRAQAVPPSSSVQGGTPPTPIVRTPVTPTEAPQKATGSETQPPVPPAAQVQSTPTVSSQIQAPSPGPAQLQPAPTKENLPSGADHKSSPAKPNTADSR